MCPDPLAQTTFEIKLGEENDEVMASIMAEMMEWERDGRKVLAPATVYSDCPYASFVEFGTLPGMEKRTGSSDEVMRKMERWVEKRKGISDYGKRHRAALRLKRHVETRGIAPSPYLRSSVELVMADICPGGTVSGDYLERGGSILGIADAIKDRVKSTLEYNGMDIYGVLKESFHAEELPYTLNGSEVTVPTHGGDTTVTEGMWQDKTLGRNNKRPTRYWKGAR